MRRQDRRQISFRLIFRFCLSGGALEPPCWVKVGALLLLCFQHLLNTSWIFLACSAFYQTCLHVFDFSLSVHYYTPWTPLLCFSIFFYKLRPIQECIKNGVMLFILVVLGHNDSFSQCILSQLIYWLFFIGV